MNQFYSQLQNLNGVVACQQKAEEISKNSPFSDIKESLKTASTEQKRELGGKLNELKKQLQLALNQRIQEIQKEGEKDNFSSFDPTFFSSDYKSSTGSLHPITEVSKEIVEIFERMGFEVADGPLVETQDYCFTKLNIPDYHPARDMQDTFFLEQKDENGENYVLRTHTSAVQIRYGLEHKPPIRIVSPGQVYRNENIDATHDIMFHQIECLIVEQNVSLSHLKTLIEQFYAAFFGQSNLRARFRPSYFPYTIPSLEVDISNPFKDKIGSKLANQDWIEAGGAGLVHPKVIENMGLDSKEWQGLAFGFGIDRMAQLKLGVTGLGQFFNGHLSFLRGKEF